MKKSPNTVWGIKSIIKKDLRIWVSDSSPGMSDEHIDYIIKEGCERGKVLVDINYYYYHPDKTPFHWFRSITAWFLTRNGTIEESKIRGINDWVIRHDLAQSLPEESEFWIMGVAASICLVYAKEDIVEEIGQHILDCMEKENRPRTWALKNLLHRSNRIWHEEIFPRRKYGTISMIDGGEKTSKIPSTPKKSKKDFFSIIPNDKNKEFIMKRLHSLIDTNKGISVVKVLAAALDLHYLMDWPTYNQIENEFGKVIHKSNYYAQRKSSFGVDLNTYKDCLQQ